MNQSLQKILTELNNHDVLNADQKAAFREWIKDIDKSFAILEFKLERTEKVKRTTAILLEETIQELEQKRKSIEETNTALQKTIEELKATQAQLIHAEKMASLGELTAGIAHEIQNPLNFVNNFSEISAELLHEMKAELEKGETEEAKSLADNVIDNVSKILHHGKRAGDIVKGMLQHSRTSSGNKEPTDINALADEYLRLSYHGMRAKDKSFNASIETNFENGSLMVNIVPQDIGRVILNLLTNAFYAVKEKQSAMREDYQPKVSITTRQLRGYVALTVSDNGNGIPAKLRDKIFQPFFTTKPTGEGTGLGLSISYDIITKGHGGEMKVLTEEGKGTEFIIQLPISKEKQV